MLFTAIAIVGIGSAVTGLWFALLRLEDWMDEAAREADEWDAYVDSPDELEKVDA